MPTVLLRDNIHRTFLIHKHQKSTDHVSLVLKETLLGKRGVLVTNRLGLMNQAFWVGIFIVYVINYF